MSSRSSKRLGLNRVYLMVSVGQVLLRLDKISKRFPGVQALCEISLEIYAGEIFGLVGENGAGKSTLVRILAGVLAPDSGSILLNGEKISIKNPADAQQKGMSFIFQERNIIPFLTIQENIFAGRLPIRANRMIDWEGLTIRTKEILDMLGSTLTPTTMVNQLSVAEQQIVEIGRALSFNSNIIVMDEPTASLSEREVATLFDIVRGLKQRGITVIFISHRLREILTITDRVAVLRDGKLIGVMPTSKCDENRLISMMVGRDIQDLYGKDKPQPQKEIVFSVRELRPPGTQEAVSFELRKGEILGLAGLVGAGRSELLKTIIGIGGETDGEIFVDGERVTFKSPLDAIRHGIGYLPENRREEGIFPFLEVYKNITLSTLARFIKRGFLDKGEERKASQHYVSALNIKTPNLDSLVFSLSGGNQQKVVLSRVLMSKPKVLLLDEPTQGIDVGSKFEIYQLIKYLAREGIGIILVSSDVSELLGLCHRILVLCQGRITAELSSEEANQEKIMYYATRFSPSPQRSPKGVRNYVQ